MAKTSAKIENKVEVFARKPDLPPPDLTGGPIGWMRQNLFKSIPDTILTLLVIYGVTMTVYGLYYWGIETAVFEASSRRECLDKSPFGACWAGIFSWFPRFIYGRYPDEEIWRVNLVFGLLLLWVAPLALSQVTRKASIGFSAALIFPFLAVAIVLGGDRGFFLQTMASAALTYLLINLIHTGLCLTSGKGYAATLIGVFRLEKAPERRQMLPAAIAAVLLYSAVFAATWGEHLSYVKTNMWGGLFLTLFIAGIAISASLPAGIILALGRRSKLPFLKSLCVVYIELIRAVPLISILFMATTMIPLFLPVDVLFDKLALVTIAICAFSAAYMAETVRGGLQAISKDQSEAAYSLGLGYWQSMGLVVMPQALRLMIPNIVGSFIGLFKDTGVVSIVGLYDLVAMLKAVSASPVWIGLHFEPFAVAATIYFIGCFGMAKFSRHLEKKHGVGEYKRPTY